MFCLQLHVFANNKLLNEITNVRGTIVKFSVSYVNAYE